MTDPALKYDLLKSAEVLTLSGAITTVLVITQGLRYAFGWPAKYIGLIVSLLLALLGVWLSNDHSGQAWIVSIPNGFIIYLSAAGVGSMYEPRRQRVSKRRAKAAPSSIEEIGPAEELSNQRTFWGSWFS